MRLLGQPPLTRTLALALTETLTLTLTVTLTLTLTLPLTLARPPTALALLEERMRRRERGQHLAPPLAARRGARGELHRRLDLAAQLV